MFVAVLISLFACTTAHANGQRFSETDIRERIVGKRIYLAAPFGGEFPLNYRSGGTVDGSGEALGLGRFAKPRDSGTWWIKGDRLCQKFRTWYRGKPMCFELYPIGSTRLRWLRNDGKTGTARIGPSL
ncbi:hypothetical protein [Sinorhizobium sp. BG8]|uniref:hypothetical protein n=1 Tax=Sinorhizobium sp. BG8 TaxID=2613773 RepID=UPI001FED5A87|nr:hypothetical protein [Sinorhizobium sp. BG8]